jgi:plasmid stabilization system protein ParE
MSNPLRLVWFPEALADLDRLRNFLHVNSPTAATRAAQRIKAAARKLVSFPYLGHPVEDIDSPPLRDFFVAFGKAGYVMRYAVTDNAVVIVKIWHSRENRNPQEQET